MRIVIAAEHAGIGAAETTAFTLAAELGRRGHEVELLVYPGFEQRATSWLEGAPVRVVTVPQATGARFRAALARLRRSPRPAIVHVNHAASPVLVAAWIARIRARIVTDHVLPLRPTYGAKGELLRRLTRASATRVIVFSEQNAEAASSSWGDVPVRVVYPGVPEPTCDRPREDVRRSLGIPADVRVVTSVGRLSEQKRMDVLLRALALLEPEVHALVVGEGKDRSTLEALARDRGVAERVTFTGHRTEGGCLLAATDLYVQCSAWEGICLAVLEAMAAGLPCVVTDLPALCEAVGDDASVVPVSDPQALARSIRVALDDPIAAAGRGERLRARWASTFTVAEMARGTQRVYLEALGSHRPLVADGEP